MWLAGHLWTIAPSVRHRLAPERAPAAQPWSTVVADPVAGEVSLTGALRDVPGSDACLIVVHGLGGGPDAFYCVRAAHAAERAGLSCLRLSLRGADRRGDDFYHAGLTADLEAAVASPALARYQALYVLGYSLGGHVSLRFATAPGDARVRSVAAVCAPLDLELSARAIDRPGAAIYRRHVLAGLNEIYAAVARRRAVPTPLSRVRAARTIREWDGLTVVPRHGFGSVGDYYASMSVAPRLQELQVSTLLLQSVADPMVPRWTYERYVRTRPDKLELRMLDGGGHVGFARALGLEQQVVDWLARPS